MAKYVKVVSKFNKDKTAIMEPQHITPECNWELYVEPTVVLDKEDKKDLSYSEMKKVAEDKGLEFKGNIKKSELEDLIKGE